MKQRRRSGGLSRWGLYRLLPLLIVSLLAGGCTEDPRAPLTLLTNVTDVAFAVERFNAQAQRPVNLTFADGLTEVLTQENPDADIVIGRWINTPGVNDLMLPRGDGVWTALSYNLPALVFATGMIDATDDFAVSFSALTEKMVPSSALTENPPPLLAPTAPPEGLYAIYRSLGFTPQVASDGLPTWPAAILDEAVSSVTEWRTAVFGTPEAEDAYVLRYLYEPPLRQLETGRIGLVYQNSARLFSWSFMEDDQFDFRWLEGPDGRIRVNEDVVYAGIPFASKNQEDAELFLQWLLDPTVQVDLVYAKADARIDTFGFMEGFSTIPGVNEEIVRLLYPRLTGRIPTQQILHFPGVKPRYWNEAVRFVVAAYLAEPGTGIDLPTRLERWYRQRGD